MLNPNSRSNFLFFLVLEEGRAPLFIIYQADVAAASVFALASFGGCWLVEAQSASRTAPIFDLLIKGGRLYWLFWAPK